MNKNYLWNIVCVIFISCIINGIVWIGFHGIPLIGLPEKEEVERVTIVYNNPYRKEAFVKPAAS